MLRSMRALHEPGSRRAACDWQLGGFSDVSDGDVLRLRFLLRVGFVESLKNPMCQGVGLIILPGL